MERCVQGRIGPRRRFVLRRPSRVEASSFAGLFRFVGYGLLGGGAFVAVVILASLLQSDLAKAWAAEIRRLREKAH